MSSPIDAWLASRPDLAAAVNASDTLTIEGTAHADSGAPAAETARAARQAPPAAASAPASAPAPQTDSWPAETAETAQQAGQQDAGNANSHAAPSPQDENAAGIVSPAGKPDGGNVPAVSLVLDEAALTAARVHVRDRLMQHGQWKRIIATAKEMRLDAKLAGMPTEARERFIWSELDRLYPPLTEISTSPKAPSAALLNSAKSSSENDLQSSTTRNSGAISGLSNLPKSWPELPANVSLAAEVGWVQAERLRIVEERPGSATVVTLAKARSPAPSWAALSWLETSIRSYAKFVEVAAKVASAPDDEQAQVKRERMAIDEIRSLLTEMLV